MKVSPIFPLTVPRISGRSQFRNACVVRTFGFIALTALATFLCRDLAAQTQGAGYENVSLMQPVESEVGAQNWRVDPGAFPGFQGSFLEDPDSGESVGGAQLAPPKDAATEHSKAAPPAPKYDEQTKRILGIIPNFRSISTNEKLPPQSVKVKFITATQDSFDYSSVFIPLVLAGYSQMTDSTPEFGSGGTAYGRYLWHAVVDQTQENYMVEFVIPALTHEDTRFYTLGHGGFWKRAGYSLSRAVITRSDSGKEVFNLSEVVGAGASAGISTLYYPTRERSFGNTGKEWGLDVGIDAASFVAKEFWPNINHWLFHREAASAAGTQ